MGKPTPDSKLDEAAARVEVDALVARPMTLLQHALYETMTPVEREIAYLEHLLSLPDTRVIEHHKENQ